MANPRRSRPDALLLLRCRLSPCRVPAVLGRPRQLPGLRLCLGAAWSLSRPAMPSVCWISRWLFTIISNLRSLLNRNS